MKLAAIFLFFVVAYCDDDSYPNYTKELGTCNQDEPKNINAENALTVALLQGMVDRVDQKTGHRQMILLAKGRRRFMKQYGKHDWEDSESKLDEVIRHNCTSLIEAICIYAIDTENPPQLPCNSKRHYYRGKTDAAYTVKEALGNDFVLPMTTEERLEYCENWTKLASRLWIPFQKYWDRSPESVLTKRLNDYYNPAINDARG